jgi:uncharacterized small protein (DUF1192 family)
VIGDDDETPHPRPEPLAQRRLEPLGVAELSAYIEALRAEIARAEAEILRKSSHRSAADAFFRRG